MSLLTATPDDLKSGRGRPLPDRVWRATVDQAAIVATDNGSRVEARLTAFRDRNGKTEITLPDGGTYRPRNRKVFDRQWIDHSNPDTVRYSKVKKQAVSAGLMTKNGNGTYELDLPSWEDYARALIGRDVLVRTRQVRAMTKNAAGVLVPAFEDADGNTTQEAQSGEVANTPKFNVEVADYLVEQG